MSQIGVGAATLRGIYESVPSGKNRHLSSKRHLAIQGTHILVVKPHTAMGDGPSHRPAVGGVPWNPVVVHPLIVIQASPSWASRPRQSRWKAIQWLPRGLLTPCSSTRSPLTGCTHTGLGIF